MLRPVLWNVCLQDVCQSIELERAERNTQREWIEWAHEQYDAPDGGIASADSVPANGDAATAAFDPG